MTPTLLKTSLRHLLKHPWQVGLAILGVALGVAVVVSIDLANASARRAFALSTETITGRTTHQIVGGPSGLDEALYRRVRVDLGLRDSAPVVEGYAVALDHSGLTPDLLRIGRRLAETMVELFGDLPPEHGFGEEFGKTGVCAVPMRSKHERVGKAGSCARSRTSFRRRFSSASGASRAARSQRHRQPCLRRRWRAKPWRYIGWTRRDFCGRTYRRRVAANPHALRPV